MIKAGNPEWFNEKCVRQDELDANMLFRLRY